MFGIFKRVANLERLRTATAADIGRLHDRVRELEDKVFPPVSENYFQCPVKFYNGKLISVGTGKIEPVQRVRKLKVTTKPDKPKKKVKKTTKK